MMWACRERLALNFHLPQISLDGITDLLIPSIAVALFGLMETVSITKAMSQMTGDPLDPSKEMVGQGIASMVGGFFLCIPSSGVPFPDRDQCRQWREDQILCDHFPG